MNILARMSEMSGQYEGRGTNHDDESFIGKLSLATILDGKGVEIAYSATGIDGTRYHMEKTIISTDPSGSVKMWNLNSNSPGMVELELRRTDDGIVFGIGDLSDKKVFREEIKIELDNENIGYHYSWGMPGGDFAYRSGLKMYKT